MSEEKDSLSVISDENKISDTSLSSSYISEMKTSTPELEIIDESVKMKDVTDEQQSSSPKSGIVENISIARKLETLELSKAKETTTPQSSPKPTDINKSPVDEADNSRLKPKGPGTPKRRHPSWKQDSEESKPDCKKLNTSFEMDETSETSKADPNKSSESIDPSEPIIEPSKAGSSVNIQEGFPMPSDDHIFKVPEIPVLRGKGKIKRASDVFKEYVQSTSTYLRSPLLTESLAGSSFYMPTFESLYGNSRTYEISESEVPKFESSQTKIDTKEESENVSLDQPHAACDIKQEDLAVKPAMSLNPSDISIEENLEPNVVSESATLLQSDTEGTADTDSCDIKPEDLVAKPAINLNPSGISIEENLESNVVSESATLLQSDTEGTVDTDSCDIKPEDLVAKPAISLNPSDISIEENSESNIVRKTATQLQSDTKGTVDTVSCDIKPEDLVIKPAMSSNTDISIDDNSESNIVRESATQLQSNIEGTTDTASVANQQPQPLVIGNVKELSGEKETDPSSDGSRVPAKIPELEVVEEKLIQIPHDTEESETAALDQNQQQKSSLTEERRTDEEPAIDTSSDEEPAIAIAAIAMRGALERNRLIKDMESVLNSYKAVIPSDNYDDIDDWHLKTFLIFLAEEFKEFRESLDQSLAEIRRLPYSPYIKLSSLFLALSSVYWRKFRIDVWFKYFEDLRQQNLNLVAMIDMNQHFRRCCLCFQSFVVAFLKYGFVYPPKYVRGNAVP